MKHQPTTAPIPCALCGTLTRLWAMVEQTGIRLCLLGERSCYEKYLFGEVGLSGLVREGNLGI